MHIDFGHWVLIGMLAVVVVTIEGVIEFNAYRFRTCRGCAAANLSSAAALRVPHSCSPKHALYVAKDGTVYEFKKPVRGPGSTAGSPAATNTPHCANCTLPKGERRKRLWG